MVCENIKTKESVVAMIAIPTLVMITFHYFGLYSAIDYLGFSLWIPLCATIILLRVGS
jgi:hypothetical protein